MTRNDPDVLVMSSDALLHLLAAVAHQLWCEGMTGTGWKAGPAYNEAAREHDAIVPFAHLSPVDQKDLLRVARDHAGPLVRSIDYPRGPDREFSADEMRVGLPVGWAEHVASDDPSVDLAAELGTVVEWECSPPPVQRTLKRIRVRWPGGDVRDHIPCLRELRRVT